VVPCGSSHMNHPPPHCSPGKRTTRMPNLKSMASGESSDSPLAASGLSGPDVMEATLRKLLTFLITTIVALYCGCAHAQSFMAGAGWITNGAIYDADFANNRASDGALSNSFTATRPNAVQLCK
jgi:hypothetical protein